MSATCARWLVGAGLLVAMGGCTATHEASLGEDRPRLHAHPDADAPIVAEPSDADVARDDDAGDATWTTPRADAQTGRTPDRDAGQLVDAQTDAGPAVCTLYGHRPFDGLPTASLPRPDEWDGGVPPRLGDPLSPPSGLPLEFEAGVPPFCCTLTTPWFCAPPSSSP